MVRRNVINIKEGGVVMWVYIRTDSQLFTVGHHDPNGKWHTDSDHTTKEEAGDRVHYLNGGTTLKKEAA